MLSKLIYLAVLTIIFLIAKKVIYLLDDNDRSKQARKRFNDLMKEK